jgi:gluconokinase
MIIILFGLSGAGKSYIGEIVKENFSFYHLDADTLLTVPMQACIADKNPFSQEMRNEHCEIVLSHLKNIQKTYENIVVSIGLYKELNRKQIQKNLTHARFILVTTEVDIILERIKSRNNLIDGEYATQISQNFELPTIKHFILNNNNNENSLLIQELKSIILYRA